MADHAASSYRVSALDVRRLSLFLAVADHGGFSRAAQAVHISQPALSQAIAELEADLGGPLFHRLGRRITLTAAGEALLGPARSVLRAVDTARQVTAEVTGLARGRLDLSALRTLSADPLPSLIGPFLRLHPQVEIRLASPDDPGELIEQVRSGAAEVGITDGSQVPSGLEVMPLGDQELVLVLPPGSAPPPDVMDPADVEGLPLVVTPRGTSGRDILDVWLAESGVEARIAVETGQREAVVPLVLAGAGAALLPAATARMAAAAGAVMGRPRPRLVRRLVAVHRSEAPTPAAREFLRLAAGRAGTDSPDVQAQASG